MAAALHEILHSAFCILHSAMNPRRIKVGLELTSKCNLRCGMCPLPVLRRPYEDMAWPLVERAAKEIHGNGFRLKWLHEMGEPLLYSRLEDRKSTRLNSSHEWISYAVFCLKKKKKEKRRI